MLRSKHPPNFMSIAAVLIVLLPLGYVLHLITQAGEIPNFDYWWIIQKFYGVQGFSHDLGDWIFRNNEHLVLIPSLVYALNIILTKGSNIGLSIFAFSFALLQSLLLIGLLPRSLRQSPLIWVVSLLCVTLFNFTPAAAHNWMRGFSGVIWIGANLFAIASIFCTTQLVEELKYHNFSKDSSRFRGKSGSFFQQSGNIFILLGWLIGSIVCGILAALNYSTSLALWPVLCAIAIALKFPKRLIFVYFSVSAIVLSLYFLTYKTPPHHPSLARLSFGETLAYIPIYMGAIFTHQLALACILGLLGLLATAVFALYWLTLPPSSTDRSSLKQAWLPWLAIQAYTLGTALMAAVSRSGFGLGQARSSRYATLPALFWLGLVIIILSLLAQQVSPRQYWRSLLPFLAVFAVFVSGMYGVGGNVAQEIARRATLQPIVALSLQLEAPDPTIVQEVVGNRPEAFLGMAQALKANQLVPFTKDVTQENPCVPLGVSIDPYFLNSEPQDNIPGYFDILTPMSATTQSSDTARVSGWAGSDRLSIRCIAILNQDKLVRGFAIPGIPRPDVAEAMGPTYQWSGWKGYIRKQPGDEQFTAYAALQDHQGWVALRNSHKFNE